MFTIQFGKGKALLLFSVGDDGRVTLEQFSKGYFSEYRGEKETYIAPPVEIEISGRGNHLHFADRHIGCSESDRLLYESHTLEKGRESDTLILTLKDDVIRVKLHYEYFADSDAVSTYAEVENIGEEEISLEYISSLALYGIMGNDNYANVNFYVPYNGWYSECQWKKYPLSEVGIVSGNPFKSMKKYCVSNTGAWSTKSYLPMGILENTVNGKFLLWQIESNGSWSYELGDYFGSVSLHIGGPNYTEHGWLKKLAPGEAFATVRCAVCFGDSMNEIMADITRYRRKLVKANDSTQMPIIFNEYMFGSWNCPSWETAKQYAPSAKRAGADYYVIDCGWHDEETNPFYHIGKWREGKSKYPQGLKNTLEYIRGLGLKVGLWIEPECVGSLGDAKEEWEESCFFSRGGKTMLVSDRYQLDFRRKEVVKRLDETIDRLMRDYRLDYIKIDYNIEPCNGSDRDGDSAADALLEHTRAVNAWMRGIQSRYPELVIEACASGGNRMDYLTLSAADMVSTSDQTNYLLYPYIIANILSAVLPEQAGIWSYPVSDVPKGEITADRVVLNMVNAMPGRMHLASKLSDLPDDLFALVQEGTEYYKYIADYKKDSVPFFPRGFADFGDKTLAFGIKNEKKAFIFAYALKDNVVEVDIGFVPKEVKIGYPSSFKGEYVVEGSLLTIKFPDIKQAGVFEIEIG